MLHIYKGYDHTQGYIASLKILETKHVMNFGILGVVYFEKDFLVFILITKVIPSFPSVFYFQGSLLDLGN